MAGCTGSSRHTTRSATRPIRSRRTFGRARSRSGRPGTGRLRRTSSITCSSGTRVLAASPTSSSCARKRSSGCSSRSWWRLARFWTGSRILSTDIKKMVNELETLYEKAKEKIGKIWDLVGKAGLDPAAYLKVPLERGQQRVVDFERHGAHKFDPQGWNPAAGVWRVALLPQL